MPYTKFIRLLISSILVILIFSNVGAQEPLTITVPQVLIPESHDFATMVLRDPWDMSEFTDISQYLNESGQRDIVRNPRVANGIYTGTSAGGIAEGNNGNFFPLFPGYETTMLIGKVGHRYPIDADLYHCLYVAMKVDSPTTGFVPDRFRVFWFADERLNTAGSEFYGSTFPIKIFEEASSPPPGKHIWSLHKVDLSTPPEGFAGGTATWNDRSSWQGLRIDPTGNADTNFAVDWVRLTNCQSNTQTINWTPNTSLTTMWLRPEGTNRNIRVATDVVGSSGSYQLDVQGIAPGRYVVGLSQSNSDCCFVESSQILEINQTPIVNFVDPNFYSGPDYASQAGNAWDFQDPADVVKVGGAQSQLKNGVLDLVTQSSRNADPKVFLNTPQVIPNAGDYRYFNFRMYTEGPWQNVTDGMILRWIWVQLNNRGEECYRVSHDIPFDVGWQIYTVDLHDVFQGNAEEVAGSCSGLSWHWLDSSPISKFRLDPNENILGVPLHQQLDWVRLTKPPSAQQGTPFTIRIGINKPPDEIRSINFYYTDDPSSPTQHQLKEFTSAFVNSELADDAVLQNAELLETVLLPVAVKDYFPRDLPGTAHEIRINWDTSAVSSGEYFICTIIDDSINDAVFCSEATVRVTSN